MIKLACQYYFGIVIDNLIFFLPQDYLEDFAAPERSSIWKTFGSAGDHEEDFCVADGAFAYQRVMFPKKGCVRRQWNMNGTVPVWEPPEWATSITQTTQNYPDWATLLGMSAHFKTHLHVGGYNGDMSDFFSTNEYAHLYLFLDTNSIVV